MKILGIHEGGSGCAVYRMLLPLEELARHGHEVTLRSARLDATRYGKVHILTEGVLAGGGYDVIVGQRLSHYDALGAWRRARTPLTRLAYENDDDVFSVTMENWAAYQHYDRADVTEAIRASCEAADLVTVTTETLAQVHRAWSANVAVLPNCLPSQAYRERPGGAQRKVLGWAGGASHARDIHVATPAVRRFLRRFPDWDLALAGTDFRGSFKVPAGRVGFTPWVNMADDLDAYYRLLSPFDIGICPLLDTTFGRSKSAIKALEYSAQGIPVIASDVQPYRELITHGETGFLARTDHEWLRCLSELALDDGLRAAMGAAARERAREFAITSRWADWEAAYTALFKARSAA